MTLALDHEIGVREMLDYRNHRVLAAYGPVGFTGLGMVIKMDAAELNQPLGKRFGYAMLLLFALVVAGVLLLRRRLEPLTEALQNAREEASRVAMQFKSAAESSLDAYFIMDAVRDRDNAIGDFRVRYLNASGEVLIGRPSEDVLGRTLCDVLPAEQAAFFIERYRRIVTTGEALSENFRTAGTRRGGVLGRASGGQARRRRLRDCARHLGAESRRGAATEPRGKRRPDGPAQSHAVLRAARAGDDARASRSRRRRRPVSRRRPFQAGQRHARTRGRRRRASSNSRSGCGDRFVPTDTVARLSGDEFAILLSDVDDIGSAESVAAHIVDAIRAPFDVGGKSLLIGTSIGVGFSPRGLESAQSLVARADRKLYQAKAAGRGALFQRVARHARRRLERVKGIEPSS